MHAYSVLHITRKERETPVAIQRSIRGQSEKALRGFVRKFLKFGERPNAERERGIHHVVLIALDQAAGLDQMCCPRVCTSPCSKPKTFCVSFTLTDVCGPKRGMPPISMLPSDLAAGNEWLQRLRGIRFDILADARAREAEARRVNRAFALDEPVSRR